VGGKKKFGPPRGKKKNEPRFQKVDEDEQSEFIGIIKLICAFGFNSKSKKGVADHQT